MLCAMLNVAGVDSSTQSCKVVVCDVETGRIEREDRADHPEGTEVDPAAWEEALHSALAQAGGLDDVAAVAVGGQQHGMVALDEDGAVFLGFVEESLELKRDYVVEHGADVLVMGDDWAGKFDELGDVCEVVYLERTPAISTTAIIEHIADL